MPSTLPSPLPEDWSERLKLDRAHAWHPFTQEAELATWPPVPIHGAEGCDLLLADGRRVLDGISSWWTNLHGHGHPRLISAIERQAAKLDHVMFAGFTHEPALELLTRLAPRMPAGLTRAFFSDDGSTAVEVALKMAFQAQLQRGETDRARFGALAGGYHGDTLGAVGVGELDNFFTGLFRPLLLHCERLEVPEDPRFDLAGPDAEWPARLDRAKADLRAFFAEHGPRLAAFIAEPLVQGAGGMRFWPVELLAELRAACTEHGVYLIADEVMTGFGRTGSFFACEQAGVAPDLMCLSKGLTGGLLPLSLTWATEEIYGHFLGRWEEGKAFLHGHSFTANPIACAVASASLALFDEEPVLARAADLHEALKAAWAELGALPAIRRARVRGCIAAARMVDPATGEPYPASERAGTELHRRALDHGLFVRPMGDCLYLLPPLSTPPARIREAVGTLVELLR
ncbi:MAG TPA: adenosylmethionine--8-amino-7-oxononanoate transaminase [Holophagaceae bacterium]|nr:adenosylmethionine--8-amino-7-oxononanoate transaminase [Holophagaceae bacterium]